MQPVINAFTRKGDVVLLSRDATGELVEHTEPAEYVAYYRRSEALWADWRRDPRVLRAETQGDWVRVAYKAGYYDQNRPNRWTGELGAWVEHRAEACRSSTATPYEADVHPVRRLISDRGYAIARPRRVYLDIETDSRVRIVDAKEGKARVLCWSLVDETGAVLTGMTTDDCDEAEAECLAALWESLTHYDQVVAWNGDDFDFPVIKLRSRKHDICPDTRRWLWLDHLQAFKRYNIMSAESGEEKQSFRLDVIATQVVGYGKHDFDSSKTYEAWVSDRQRLLDYCVQDTKLLHAIEQKTGYLELFQTICEVCNIFPESRSLKPTKQVDGFMLRMGVERGVHFKTVWYGDAEDDAEIQFEGAFVMAPTCRGLTKDVHVADFASLYPSIMISWNLSPEVKLDRSAEGCRSPLTGVVTSITAKGLIPIALERLLALRAEWNAKRKNLTPGTPEAKEAERRTNAYKQVANGFYGVAGNIHSRFFDKEIAESTTLNGQWLIKKTIEAAATRGWDTVYGDTDSVFVVGCTKEEFTAFVEWCNTELYPPLMREQGCVANVVSLAYEKQFSWIVFTSAKRYCGMYSHYKGKAATADSKPEIKGLGYKRGDTARLARELQEAVIRELVAGHHTADHYPKLIERYLELVLRGELRVEDVVLSKALTQEPEEYTAVMSHVKIAEMLRERGEDITVGSRIGYVVADASVSPMRVIPALDYTGDPTQVDRYYLWERRVYPPTQRLLEAAFPEFTKWKRWAKVRPKSPKRGGPGVGQMALF